MRNLLFGATLALSMATSALADFQVVVPQKPSGGTGVWANLVATEINKYLPADDQLVLEFIPGEKDRKALKDYARYNKAAEGIIQITHGGNAESFLQLDLKGFDYRDLEPVLIQNLDIIISKLSNFKPENGDRPILSSCSGCASEAMAIALLTCGPGKSVDGYLACFKEEVSWIPGMSGGDRRIAFKNGELNASRDNPIKTRQKYGKMFESGTADIWFSHGVLNASTGQHEDDPNFPNSLMEDKFMSKWGEAPSGEFYDAYKLLKSWRDGLQKTFFIPADHPRKDVLHKAVADMLANADSVALLEKEIGVYPTLIGAEAQAHLDMLFTLITKESLENLLHVSKETIGAEGIFKPELLQ